MSLRKPAPKTFELGLVMAGAVSAGAYTAGVIDFLYEALAEWEKEKLNAFAQGTTIPDHKVVIRACSGASAGGICSALAAMVPFTGHTPTHVPPAAGAQANNLFYDGWVRDIDISQLLETTDLAGGGPVPSLLNGGAIDSVGANIAKRTRDAIAAPPIAKPSWIANPLQLYLSIGNIRGVPYLIQMVAADPVRGHRVVAHADYAHFAVVGAGAGALENLPVGASAINWPGRQGNPAQDGWDYLVSAAVSTAAFPIGLPTRQFRNPKALYNAKMWNRLPGTPEDGAAPTIIPDLPPDPPPPISAPDYQFWTVDGGVFNNEPLECARTALSGAPDAHNEREPEKADRAVLMIDPFPDDTGQKVEMGTNSVVMPDIFGVVFALIGSMKSQSRFKPDEIRLALHEDIHSRFLIAPSREGRKEGETNIASDGLSGFSGFLHERFRAHDFFLGRRNCQQFLRNHLVIHRDNPIVAGWVQKLSTGALAPYHPISQPAANSPPVRDEAFVQLVPLFGTAAAECKAPDWPILDFDKDISARIADALEKRSDTLAKATVQNLMEKIGMGAGLIADLISWIARNKLSGFIQKKALATMKADLKKRNLC
jgi:hypothetical protein